MAEADFIPISFLFIFRLIVKKVYSPETFGYQTMLFATVECIANKDYSKQFEYMISLFDTDTRENGHQIEAKVSSYLDQISFINGFAIPLNDARKWMDQWNNLNFIVMIQKYLLYLTFFKL